MIRLKIALLLSATLILASCSGGGALFERMRAEPVPNEIANLRNYDIVELNISVPETLEVSERNLYYPVADIVWREEAYGNRYAQVQAIFEEGMVRGVQGVRGLRPVRVSVEVARFHSLTEKARFTIGGVHSIRFILTVADANNGAVIEGPRRVVADFDAFGGQEALDAVKIGQTQRVRIVDHLARVIRAELSKPQDL